MVEKWVINAIKELLGVKIDSKSDPKRYFKVEFNCDNYMVARLVQNIISTLPYDISSEKILIKCSECFEEINFINEVCENCDEFFNEESEVE
tara:strand:+ start:43 stop:318 length:276 start_codon:yes stop_codon:yes gene_type:complete